VCRLGRELSAIVRVDAVAAAEAGSGRQTVLTDLVHRKVKVPSVRLDGGVADLGEESRASTTLDLWQQRIEQLWKASNGIGANRPPAAGRVLDNHAR
jgi:hypothetical protein